MSNAAAPPAADGSRLRRAVLVPLILAALAAMPNAYASIEATTTASEGAPLSGPPTVAVALAAGDVASPPPQGVPTDGGAFFSPFATTLANSATPARRPPQSAAYESTGGAGLATSIAFALAALAAIGCLLRRVSR